MRSYFVCGLKKVHDSRLNPNKNNDGYVGYEELAHVLEEYGLIGVSYRELVNVI